MQAGTSLTLFFWKSTGVFTMAPANWLMLIIAVTVILFSLYRSHLPQLLIPLGFGMVLANIPLPGGASLLTPAFLAGKAGPLTAADYLYTGLAGGYLPALLLLGLGAALDFTPLLASPRLFLLGAAGAAGLFGAMALAAAVGITPGMASAFGLAGMLNAPAALFTVSRLAPGLYAPLALSIAISLALLPFIAAILAKLLTSKAERLIRMEAARRPERFLLTLFPVVALIVCTLVVPSASLMLGMFFLGNILRESGITDRLAETARTRLSDLAWVLTGISAGVGASAEVFLRGQTLAALFFGLLGMTAALLAGILVAKLMNLFVGSKVNPLLGAACLSATPEAARGVHLLAAGEDPTNYLLGHAAGVSVAGVLASIICAGVILTLFGF